MNGIQGFLSLFLLTSSINILFLLPSTIFHLTAHQPSAIYRLSLEIRFVSIRGIRVRRNRKQYNSMFNLDKFIADSVTFRPVSMFAADIEANKILKINETITSNRE